MLKRLALIFGIVFVVIGLLGWVPGITTTDSDGMNQLLGLFMVDNVHNVVHLLTGVVGLVAAMDTRYAKWFLVGFGAIYGLVFIIGLFDSTVLGLFKVNVADNVLHLVLAVALLWAGLGVKDAEVTTAKAAM